MVEIKSKVEGIDTEWVKLMVEAKNLGIEKEKIREFLMKNSVKQMIIEGR
ncbi:anti-repressor SinI family protein [Cytobacillus sp. FJAT-53684]|uniref:Anti-repressor SinI family protein n=1 Tax=Cytobacillus mangrovibacter TaxID=3299024 RepID=A0ABW6JZP4_9BACI